MLSGFCGRRFQGFCALTHRKDVLPCAAAQFQALDGGCPNEVLNSLIRIVLGSDSANTLQLLHLYHMGEERLVRPAESECCNSHSVSHTIL